MIKLILREDLPQPAKDIFGDIVKTVYSDVYTYEEDKIEDYLTGGKRCRAYLENGKLSFDDDFVIEFTNGRFVKFRTSEWADISIAPKKDIINPHA